MKEKTTKNLLIRNVPIEVYELLKKTALQHHRSNNQEAIVAITKGLSLPDQPIQKIKRLKWDVKVSQKTIQKAIDEGRE